MSQNVLLGHINHIDKSWKSFLEEAEKLVCDIEQTILQNVKYTPDAVHVLRFLDINLNQVKVIILGQDPYPQEGVATGKAFEVGTLRSWTDKFSNISLKNIVRSIYKAQTGEILKYSEILQSKFSQSFYLLPPDRIFNYWENQGVLLLNTSFTCEIGKPGSHAKVWQPFTTLLLDYIAERNKNAIWFLWGDQALKITKDIDIQENNKIISFHPMMCFDRENDFLYGKVNCFKETWDLIDWTGYRDKQAHLVKQNRLF